MQPELPNNDRDHVSKGRRGQNKRQIRPAQCRHIRRHKANQDNDSRKNPGVRERIEKGGEVMDGDRSNVVHPTTKKGIAHSGAKHDAQEQKVTRSGKAVRHLSLFYRRSALLET